MRKHFYLVTEHEQSERVGCCKIMDSRMSQPLKNEEGPIQALDEEKQGFEVVGKMVGMGYADFEDEEDYEERVGDVIQAKLREIDSEWLDKAGVDMGEHRSMSETAADGDPLLEVIESGDVYNQLLGYIDEDESAEEALGRLIDSLPSFASRECAVCGRDLSPLSETDWLAWRLKVEDADFRRTDLFCGLSCLAESMDARIEMPVTNTMEDFEDDS